MSLREDLLALRKHLTPKENWTQGCWARSHAKRRFPKEPWFVLPTDPRTDQWCLVGGVSYVTYEVPFCWSRRSIDMFEALADGQNINDSLVDWLIRWNDWKGRHHAEVLRRIDEAIAKLPEEEITKLPNVFPDFIKERVLEDV